MLTHQEAALLLLFCCGSVPETLLPDPEQQPDGTRALLHGRYHLWRQGLRKMPGGHRGRGQPSSAPSRLWWDGVVSPQTLHGCHPAHVPLHHGIHSSQVLDGFGDWNPTT